MSATHWPPEFGDITQRPAGQSGLVQVMLLFEQAVKLGPLKLEEQTDGDVLQEIGFTGKGCANHAPMLAPGRAEVQSLFIPLMPACLPSPLTKQPRLGTGFRRS